VTLVRHGSHKKAQVSDQTWVVALTVS